MCYSSENRTQLAGAGSPSMGVRPSSGENDWSIAMSLYHQRGGGATPQARLVKLPRLIADGRWLIADSTWQAESHYQLSAIGHRLFAIGHQLSAMPHQAKAVIPTPLTSPLPCGERDRVRGLSGVGASPGEGPERLPRHEGTYIFSPTTTNRYAPRSNSEPSSPPYRRWTWMPTSFAMRSNSGTEYQRMLRLCSTV